MFREKINELTEAIIKRFLPALSDGKSRYKNIYISEYWLFAFAFGFFLWLILFDITQYSQAIANLPFQPIWTFIMGSISIAHILSLYKFRPTLRVWVLRAYIGIWTAWGIFAAFSAIGSPLTVVFFILMLFSGVVSINVERQLELAETDKTSADKSLKAAMKIIKDLTV